MPANNHEITITCVLTHSQALAFSQFLKRVYFSDYRSNAVDDTEAHTMVDAGEVVRASLARAGYAPR